MRRAALTVVLLLSACNMLSWQGRAVAFAEDKIRNTLDNQSARFSREQVIGDSKTGQTCGYVTSTWRGAPEKTARFIVFIDASAGPFVEGMGALAIDDDAFARMWKDNCVAEGYDS